MQLSQLKNKFLAIPWWGKILIVLAAVIAFPLAIAALYAIFTGRNKATASDKIAEDVVEKYKKQVDAEVTSVQKIIKKNKEEAVVLEEEKSKLRKEIEETNEQGTDIINDLNSSTTASDLERIRERINKLR